MLCGVAKAKGLRQGPVEGARGLNSKSDTKNVRGTVKEEGVTQGMRRAGTDLAHAGCRVHIPLDARQHRAVVLQENAVLLSTAAPEISGLVVGGDNNTHGALQAASICGWAAGHPYCGGRRRLSWNAMGDGGIVVQVRVADGLMQVCDKAKVALPERGSTKASRQRERRRAGDTEARSSRFSDRCR
jgi:hypothetical protein